MKWFKKMNIHQTITAITLLGVIGGALAAFRISFDNLTKEAQAHGIAADVAIFIPVIIDGFIVIFGIALLFFKSIQHAAGEKLSKQAI